MTGELAAMSRTELIEFVLGERGELSDELRWALRQAFRRATTEELRELADCVIRNAHGEDVDDRAEQLGARSGERARRAREGEQR